MVEPITLGSLALTAFSGVLGNRSDWLFCQFGNQLMASLTEVGPRNHVLRALRRAQLEALELLAKALRDGRSIITAQDKLEADEFLPRLDNFLRREKKKATELTLTRDQEKSLLGSVDAALASPYAEAPERRLAALRQGAVDSTWNEISTLQPPGAFKKLFDGLDEKVPSWFEAYSAFFGQELQSNQALRDTFTTIHLTDIHGKVVDLHSVMDQFIAESGRRHKDIKGITDAVSRTEANTEKILAYLERGQEAGLSAAQVKDLLTEFGHQGVPIERAEGLLIKAAEEIRQLRQRLAKPPTNDPEAARIRAEALAAIDNSRIADAKSLFLDAAARDLAARDEHHDALKARQLGASESYSDAARVALAQASFLEAADLFAQAAELATPFDFDMASAARRNEANACLDYARIFPGLTALERAVTILRAEVATSRDQKSLAMAQGNLGSALRVLGERSGGEAGLKALNDAVEAFRAALEIRTRKTMPADWAATQNNLGVALEALGEQSGGEAGLKALNDAAEAYRAALEIFTRETMPADWAMTQSNLGNALRTLGEQSGGEAGLKALNDAVEAFRAALEIHTRKTMPADWAATQNNLGVALVALGERSGGEAGLKALNDAVEAFRAALEIRTRETMPVQWAMTQNNLGNALRTLGERSGGEAGLKALNDAVEAYRAALEIRTRKTMPAQWAATQNNLGVALRTLGEQSGGEAGLKALNDAVEAYREALKIFTCETMPAQWAVTQKNLDLAIKALAKRSRDDAG